MGDRGALLRRTMAAALLAWYAIPAAGDWSGSVELEGRRFVNDPAYVDQSRDSLALRVKGRYTREWGGGTDFFTFAPMLRLDANDTQRNMLDLDELGWTHLMRGTELRVGLRKLFWGVTESNHLVDIVNQTDLADSPDGESKLAQPMINMAFFSDYGTVDLFVLPGFRERTFSGEPGRLRGPIPVDTDKSDYEADDGAAHIDLAARWSGTFGDLDVGVSHFRGTSREPNLVPDAAWRFLIPTYPTIRQTGLDLQLIVDAWIWKLEAIVRDGAGQHFDASAAGFEYTYYGVSGGPSDATLFVEYSRDERGAAATFGMDNDLFLGLRINFNDSDGSELMVGAVEDLDGGGRSLTLEASRRFGEVWKVGTEGRWFLDIDRGEALYAMRGDSYVQVTLERYF